MDVKLINRGSEGELLLSGRLDSHTAPEVEEIFEDVAGQFSSVVLNLEELEYVSSAGLRIIRNLHVAMRKKDGELTLKNVKKLVMEVFEITGFAGLLKIEN